MKIVLILSSVYFWFYPEEAPPSGNYNFEELLDAIAQVESNINESAVGDNGEAIGMYQIHKCYVTDVNRILSYSAYSYRDRWNAQKSRAMITVYLRHYGKNKNIEAMARIHNGGPKGYKKAATRPYWKKIKRQMDYKKKLEPAEVKNESI